MKEDQEPVEPAVPATYYSQQAEEMSVPPYQTEGGHSPPAEFTLESRGYHPPTKEEIAAVANHEYYKAEPKDGDKKAAAKPAEEKK